MGDRNNSPLTWLPELDYPWPAINLLAKDSPGGYRLVAQRLDRFVESKRPKLSVRQLP